MMEITVKRDEVPLRKMPIATERGVVVPTKKSLFVLLFVFAVGGCHLLDHQPSPNIETTPPYWQPQSQLEELRAFHDRESVKMQQMSNEVHIVRNREMERLEAAGKELEKEKEWQDDYEKTVERREKWTGWFKKKNKNEAPLTSSLPDDVKSTR